MSRQTPMTKRHALLPFSRATTSVFIERRREYTPPLSIYLFEPRQVFIRRKPGMPTITTSVISASCLSAAT